MSADRFQAIETGLEGLVILERQVHQDNRGFFERMFCESELKPWIEGKRITQINHSLTTERGSARGLHYQRQPAAEIKIVSCLQGEVFDVAVDLRRGSPTFLQWFGCVLSDQQHNAMLIPEGFAHGFQTLTADVEMLYFHTASYAPDLEGGIHLLDSKIGIDWPLPPTNLSGRDQALLAVDASFSGITV